MSTANSQDGIISATTNNDSATQAEPPTSVPTDPVSNCQFPLSFVGPQNRTVYAMVCTQVIVDGATTVYVYNTTLGYWQTTTAFAGVAYSQGLTSLTEDTNVRGNYFGYIAAPFILAAGSNTNAGGLWIEYWSQVGGSPSRSVDTFLGTRTGFWSDTYCAWFNTYQEYQAFLATVSVQTSDNSNQNIAENALDCCQKIANIEDMVRVIYAKIHSQSYKENR